MNIISHGYSEPSREDLAQKLRESDKVPSISDVELWCRDCSQIIYPFLETEDEQDVADQVSGHIAITGHENYTLTRE